MEKGLNYCIRNVIMIVIVKYHQMRFALVFGSGWSTARGTASYELRHCCIQVSTIRYAIALHDEYEVRNAVCCS